MFGRAAPCTCRGFKQRPKQQPKRLWIADGLVGRCGCAGHAVNPAPRSGPAAGGCAFGRLRSSASQTKRPHPWGLDGAIHGANGPAQPHRPTLDSFPMTVGRSTPCVDESLSDIESIRGQIRFP
ncbi:putative penicillin binding protein [Stenotrophomonas maltophilia K279a]|uniref:Penicillin binding protein n=1 Tax=Stenotrophomonas maltophilia (strain K279a) TaxID=522373 RepID=B2FN42_STRMK|nr:putative penicillin binding protein [Stenotrophomonas maltophilia K279a]